MIRRAVHRPAAAGASFPVLQGGPFEQVDTDLGPFWMLTSDEVMRPYLLDRGRWDESTTDLLEELIRPGCRFLNVGASMGYFSVFAHRIGGAATVDAVEPHPVNHSLLEANLWADDVPARTWRIALADERRLLPMTSAPMNPGDTRLAQHSPDGRYEVVVPVISGDELFTGRTFDLVKISVQGFELEVLLGMQRIVRQSAGIVLVVEFAPGILRDPWRRPLRRRRPHWFHGIRRSCPRRMGRRELCSRGSRRPLRFGGARRPCQPDPAS